MADDENQETKIPQEQNGLESAVIPTSEPLIPNQLLEENFDTWLVESKKRQGISQKMKWPEVVGLTIEEAEKIIKEEMTGVQLQVILPDCDYTMDYIERRVRIHVDSSGKVATAPIIG